MIGSIDPRAIWLTSVRKENVTKSARVTLNAYKKLYGAVTKMYMQVKKSTPMTLEAVQHILMSLTLQGFSCAMSGCTTYTDVSLPVQ